MSMLAAYLEGLYRRYDRAFLASDPIQFPHRYADPSDQELVALLSCLFAFGNVRSVLATVERILAPLGEHPVATLVSRFPSPRRREGREWSDFVHRWITREDLHALLAGLARCLAEWGSLKACFLVGFDRHVADIGPALSAFSGRLRAAMPRQSIGMRFLLSDPATGSACKRLNMFLRCVVRPADGIDLGLWPEVAPAQLLIPLDTHVARIARFLGLTRRRTVNWAMAREVTDALCAYDAADPVKYDFGLSRIGIVEGCRGYRHPRVCPRCMLAPVCTAPSRGKNITH